MPDEARGAQLREYLHILRRRWGIILVVVAVTSSAALLASMRIRKQYTADTQVVVQPITNSSSPNSDLLNLLTNPTLVLQTDVALIRSDSVLGPAARTLGLASSAPLSRALGVQLVANTQILDIKVTNHVPATARDWANAVANAFIDFQHNLVAQKVATQTQKIVGNISDVETQLVAAQASKISATVIPALTSEVASLQSALNALPSAGLLDTGGATVSTPATAPTTPSSPRIKVNVALGAVLGLVLAGGLVLLSESLDDRLRGTEDIEERVGAPVLGSIPYARELSGHAASPAFVHDPSPPVAEACRTIRTNLRFLAVERPLRTLLVTSSVKAEGKSTTAANLAVTFAVAGVKTVLISADLRRPSVHKYFGLSNAEGLVDALLPESRLERLLQTNALPDFRFLAAGRIPPNPTEILASSKFGEVLQTLREVADLVIIDSTPLLGVADAGALASRVDGVLLVVNPGQVDRRTLAHATELLRRAGGHVLGTVLNAVSAGHGGYDYGYEYYAEEARQTRKAKRAAAKRRSGRSDPDDPSAAREPASGPTMDWGTEVPDRIPVARGIWARPGEHQPEAGEHPPSRRPRRTRSPMPSVLPTRDD